MLTDPVTGVSAVADVAALGADPGVRVQTMLVAAISMIPSIIVQAGALVVVDNSILAPVFQQPLALGADISMTSATKFIGGHSDITGGILSVRDPELAKQVYFFQVSCPSVSCWTTLLFTLSLYHFCRILQLFVCMHRWKSLPAGMLLLLN